MAGNNIIQKQIVQVEMNLSSISPFESQAQTAKWCNEILTPAINRKLEKYSLIDDVIRLDNVSIEIDGLNALTEQLAEKIAAEIGAIIQARVDSAIVNGSSSVLTKSGTTIEAFIFFLKNGYFPWWSNIRSVTELDEPIINELNHEIPQLKQILADPVIRKRFVTSLSPGITPTVFSILFEHKKQEIENWFEKFRVLSLMIDNKDLQFQFQIWSKQEFIRIRLNDADERGIMKSIVIGLKQLYNIPVEEIKLHFQQHQIFREDEKQILLSRESKRIVTDDDKILNAVEDKSTQDSRKKQEQQNLLKQGGIYISNAGLVLLAAFLPRFFENLGIIEGQKFNSKDLALAMLQWLVSGNDEYEEPDLVLPKILCGMEPEDAVIIIPALPESFKNEGDALLQSVIDHWEILKNTSVNGLRESFLQREGKLTKNGNEWYLQVEQKPYDMLLEHLPWNFSMTRLSWMSWLLRTEWVG